MKSKLNNRQDQIDELEDIDESAIDIEPIGPSISSGKKGKFALIVISALLISIVLYIFFFSGDDTAKENLEPVVVMQAQEVAKSEDSESPFEIDESYDLIGQEEESTSLESLPIPEIPSLPDLPTKSEDDDIAKIIEQAEAEKMKSDKAQKKSSNNAKNNDNNQSEQEDFSKEQNQENELMQILKPSLINNDNIEEKETRNQLPRILTKNELAPVRSDKSVEQDSKIMANLNPRYSPIVVFSGPSQGTNTRSVGYENNIVNLKQNSASELEETKSSVKTTIISNRGNTIAQGKLITAVLETAINTEIPGFVRAIVSRDVYGEAGNNVLIPKGSRLFGSYSSEIKRGQGRVDIGWQRLIRPDGVDIGIDFNASDQFGRAGIDGQIDNKYQSIIANSILTSILTVGGVAVAEQLLNNGSNSGNTTTTLNPTTGTTTTTGSASNQAIYDVSKTIIETIGTVLKNQVDTNPLITIPQGTKITVIVNSDINIPDLIN